jgi:methyl-accepting chemotaxis protein
MAEPPDRSALKRLRIFRGRTVVQLTLAMTACFLPITVVLAVVLTDRASTALSRSVDQGITNAATTLASRMGLVASARQADLRLVAAGIDRVDASATRTLVQLDQVRKSYNSVQLFDRRGRRVATSRPAAAALPAAGQDWFTAALDGREAIAPMQRIGNSLRWVAAVPVRQGDRVTGVIAADLDATSLYQYVAVARLGKTGSAELIDPQLEKVISSQDGKPANEAEMVASGALSQRVDFPSARQALAGRAGTVRKEKDAGVNLVTGYAPVPAIGWGVLVQQHESEAFAAVGSLRNWAILIVIVGVLITGACAALFARRAIRPLYAVAQAARSVASGDLRTRVEPSGSSEVRELGVTFNVMVESLDGLVTQIAEAGTRLATSASELSSAAEELSATTTQQTSAATETSATMEELARTSQSIAETVASAADQTEDTRAVLEDADADMQRSSERIIALAERVAEISALLDLINEIADQTNLLALNAAIEAARAGESGRGFSVVADEVRRLAERSKTSAADIAEIIDSTQAATNETVMAMEGSSKQMKRGLGLMDGVRASTDRVRLTTQQQGAATQQVVDTMDSVTEASRQTAATAHQISTSASVLNDLVDELQRAAEAVGTSR